MSIAAVVMILLGLVGNLATGGVDVPAAGKPWVWAAVAVLAIAAIFIEVYRNLVARVQPSGEPDVNQAGDRLALAIGRQWQREERQRKVHDPIALPIRWHPADEQLVDYWVNVHRAPAGAPAVPIALAGHLAEIADVYRRVPSGRMVILGPGGAGKTILAARLALDLLDTRPAGGTVPFIVSAASWNPTTTGLAIWLRDQLIRDHPGLAASRPGGQSLAVALLDAGLILPILDGFDEIPEALQRRALQQLNITPDQPLILTSRNGEYMAAVSGTDVLTAAAGIELDELTLDDLADYLPRTTRRITTHNGQTTNVWNPVLTRLRNQPNDPASNVLRQVLSTPLMTYLARTIYSDTPDHNPLDLLQPNRFATRDAAEEHLLSAYLPAVYQQPSTTGHTWPPDKAHHYLAYLARHLDQLHTRDLAWWQLRDTIPTTSRVLATALAFAVAVGPAVGLAVGSAVGLAAGSAVGLAAGLVFGLGVGLAAGLVFGFGVGPEPVGIRLRIRGRLQKVTKGFAVGLAVGLAAGLAAGLAVRPVVGLAFGVTYGLAVGLAAGLTALETPIDVAAEPSPAESLIKDRRNTIRKVLVVGLAFGLSGGLAFGLIAGLAGGLAGGLTVGLAVGLAVGLTNAWAQWLVLVRIWLPLTGRLPWPVHAFLADAHHCGVLRQAGAVYQFRHARLQHHLTAHPTAAGSA